jgi:hypothetical protein
MRYLVFFIPFIKNIHHLLPLLLILTQRQHEEYRIVLFNLLERP